MNTSYTNYPHFSMQHHLQSVYHLSDESIMLFCSIANRIVAKKGDILLNEGEVCKHIYYIEAGYLRFFYMQDGKDINTDFYFENAFATNLKSLRSSEPSEHLIECGEHAVLYKLNREDLFKLYEVPEIVAFGKELLERIVVEQQSHSTIFKLYSAEERYRHLEKYQPQLLQRVSLSQLASYLGTARETLSRIRANRA